MWERQFAARGDTGRARFAHVNDVHRGFSRVARRMQATRDMTPVEELAAVDAEWDAISSRTVEHLRAGSESAETEPPISGTFELAAVDEEWDAISSLFAENEAAPESAETEPPISGTFGHVSERRLGLRMPAACWALLRDGARGIYARAVELSPTGVVLKLFDRDVRLDGARSFGLDIFVPNASRPIHATARPARPIGELEAFELSNMNAADRLTLAEHLDDRRSTRPPRPNGRRSRR
jgi:hypothetical protein